MKHSSNCFIGVRGDGLYSSCESLNLLLALDPHIVQGLAYHSGAMIEHESFSPEMPHEYRLLARRFKF